MFTVKLYLAYKNKKNICFDANLSIKKSTSAALKETMYSDRRKFKYTPFY